VQETFFIHTLLIASCRRVSAISLGQLSQADSAERMKNRRAYSPSNPRDVSFCAILARGTNNYHFRYCKVVAKFHEYIILKVLPTLGQQSDDIPKKCQNVIFTLAVIRGQSCSTQGLETLAGFSGKILFEPTASFTFESDMDCASRGFLLASLRSLMMLRRA
jgi:hypothetical protein